MLYLILWIVGWLISSYLFIKEENNNVFFLDCLGAIICLIAWPAVLIAFISRYIQKNNG